MSGFLILFSNIHEVEQSALDLLRQGVSKLHCTFGGSLTLRILQFGFAGLKMYELHLIKLSKWGRKN